MFCLLNLIASLWKERQNGMLLSYLLKPWFLLALG
jgi:hypothetical protein